MIALVIIVGIVACVYLTVTAWRIVEGLLNGIWDGSKLFCRMVRACWRAFRWAQHAAVRLDFWLSQRIHAAWWSYSYVWQRSYIASTLRQRRRAQGRH